MPDTPALRTDTLEQQAVHYPVTTSRRTHPLPDRAEWAVQHRTAYSQDISDARNAVTRDLHAYGTDTEIETAAAELEALWKATGRQVRAANTAARAIYPYDGKHKPPGGWREAHDAYDALTEQQKQTIEDARNLTDARKHLHELAKTVREGRYDGFAAHRAAELVRAGQCAVYLELASRYHAAGEKAAADYAARITGRPTNDAAWAEELRRREGVEAYFRDGPVIHRRTITL